MCNVGTIRRQKEACERFGAEYLASPGDAIFGLATSTTGIDGPLNGLRHPPEKGTSGWYIWKGENLSDDEDFFKPMHIRHVTDECPEALDFLGLAPGWRFLIHGDYVDVWFDESLLSV